MISNVVSSVGRVAGAPLPRPSRAGILPVRVPRLEPAMAVEVEPIALGLEESAERLDLRIVPMLVLEHQAV